MLFLPPTIAQEALLYLEIGSVAAAAPAPRLTLMFLLHLCRKECACQCLEGWSFPQLNWGNSRIWANKDTGRLNRLWFKRGRVVEIYVWWRLR